MNKDPDLVSITATRLAVDEVRLERSDSGLEARTSAIFSLGLDGNVTHYETSNPESNEIKECDFSWLRDGAGRVFLGSRDYQSTYLIDGQVGQGQSISRFTGFDPSFKPRPDAFTLRSLKLDGGAVVYDRMRNRNYRIGDPEPASVYDSLDRLIESMRARGFATPER